MGVVVRRYIEILTIINFPYSTCISSFFDSSIATSLFIFKMFFVLVYVIFVQYNCVRSEPPSLSNCLRCLYIYIYIIIYIIVRTSFRKCTPFLNSEYILPACYH